MLPTRDLFSHTHWSGSWVCMLTARAVELLQWPPMLPLCRSFSVSPESQKACSRTYWPWKAEQLLIADLHSLWLQPAGRSRWCALVAGSTVLKLKGEATSGICTQYYLRDTRSAICSKRVESTVNLMLREGSIYYSGYRR